LTNTTPSSQANLVNDSSWTFDNLLPYFSRGITYYPGNSSLRAANASVPLPANPQAYNGTGPLHISHPNFAQIFASYIDGAMEESGIPFQRDFISGSLLGRQYAPLTIAYPEEERSSSQTAFLRKALGSGRGNLKVYPNMLAKRVLFDGNLTAKGVEVSDMRLSSCIGLILLLKSLRICPGFNLLIFHPTGRSVILRQH
jgi:choline dehydrogenase